MRIVDSEYGFIPDIIATKCTNSIKLKDLDFRVPCGKCLPCQKKRRSDWSLRLEHEYLFSDSAYFITLTYNDASLPRTKEGYPTLFKKHVQDYIKRLRNDHTKYVKKQFKVTAKQVYQHSKKIRYYAVGEYGSKTRRPHYHLLLFNMDIANLSPLTNQWKNTQTGVKFGHVDIGTVTGSSINYVTKYMFKDFYKKDKRQKPFALMSKKPIIGQAYLENYGTYHINNETLLVADKNGSVRRLPKAYLHRLFINKQDRLKLSTELYEQHAEQKIKQFQKNVNDNYGGKVIDYINSKKSDLLRHRHTINTNETI